MSARSGAIRAVYLVFALIGLSCAAVSQLNLLTTQQEIGHVVGKHGARKISKQYGLAVLVELAVAVMDAGLTLFKYGRDAEREADYFAVEETYAAGINPEGMATFFEKLMAQQESKQESKQLWARGWFSTHPASRERIANVREQIAELPPKAGLKKDSKRFQEIKSRILKKDKTRSGETKLRETFRAF
jgi:predicted Zn-dependent protease